MRITTTAMLLVTLICDASGDDTRTTKRITEQGSHLSANESADAVRALRDHLALDADSRPSLSDQPFASVALTKQDVVLARNALADDRKRRIQRERKEEMETRVLKRGEHEMPFFFKVFGDKPKNGRSLYISLHGGGGTAKRVNDGQWENQKRLYRLTEGVYAVPRAPTDTWNLWHQGHIDPLFDRMIENMAAFEDVDWNRVYVMGYSAGGDGVYQLAPRMSDRFAAAAMMAGHPNETSPLGLRNIPFALQVGGRDAAYNRNKIAAQWKEKLAALREDDPNGYKHFVRIYPDKGHWMDLKDAAAIPWMASHTRNPIPDRVVWKQDDVTHQQFYWLGVDAQHAKARSVVIAEVDGQTIQVSAKDVEKLIVFLDDRFINLDEPVTIKAEGTTRHQGVVTRTIASLSDTISRRGDPHLSFPASVTITP